jgi:hypothetical protein
MDLALIEEEKAREAARRLPNEWHRARNPRYERLPMIIRHCPIGADTIEIRQPHGRGGYWRIYWGGSPIAATTMILAASRRYWRRCASPIRCFPPA